MSTKEHLKNVLLQLEMQRDNVDSNIAALTEQTTVDSKVQDAIDVLVTEFDGDVKKIGQIIGGQLQLKQLTKMGKELHTMVATVQVTVGNPEVLSKVVTKLSADVIKVAAAANE